MTPAEFFQKLEDSRQARTGRCSDCWGRTVHDENERLAGAFDISENKPLDLGSLAFRRLSKHLGLPDDIPWRQDYCQFELVGARRTARLAPLSHAWLLPSP
jgi:hypothetical protein